MNRRLTSSPLPLASSPDLRSSSDLPRLWLRDRDRDRERDRERFDCLSPSSSVLISDASPNNASAVTINKLQNKYKHLLRILMNSLNAKVHAMTATLLIINYEFISFGRSF